MCLHVLVHECPHIWHFPKLTDRYYIIKYIILYNYIVYNISYIYICIYIYNEEQLLHHSFNIFECWKSMRKAKAFKKHLQKNALDSLDVSIESKLVPFLWNVGVSPSVTPNGWIVLHMDQLDVARSCGSLGVDIAIHCWRYSTIMYHIVPSWSRVFHSCWAPCSIGALVRGKVTRISASHGVTQGVTQRGTSRWDIGHPKYAMWSSLMWLDGLVQPSTWNILEHQWTCMDCATLHWAHEAQDYPRFIDIQGIHDSCDVTRYLFTGAGPSHPFSMSARSRALDSAATNISHCLKS